MRDMLLSLAILSAGLLSAVTHASADNPAPDNRDVTAPTSDVPVAPDARLKSPPGPRPSGASADKDKNARPPVTPEQRRQVLAFAREHHPELARLLEQLDKSRSGEFGRAVRELNLQIQRLERTREKSPARYAVQLESWKVDSQIRILMARWVRNHDDGLERQIRTLLRERQTARVAQLTAEQQRLEDQLKRINQQLTELAGDGEALVDKEWQQLASRTEQQKKTAVSDPPNRLKQTPDSVGRDKPPARAADGDSTPARAEAKD
jgi:DNA-binding transcriptional MerR regulator